MSSDDLRGNHSAIKEPGWAGFEGQDTQQMDMSDVKSGFNTGFSQILIIPTALELIFSTTLIITNWGTGWRHLLLTAEGWSYFALALLELLSHTIPAVRDSVSVFSIVDIVLGASSFLPIFFYTLFVYLFTRGELIDTLPKRFQRIANSLLLVFIPAIIALNEVSSFIGISRRTIISGGREVVAIGFTTPKDQELWTFLTSLTLALLTAFEAINFCFAFYRLIRAFVDQRRIETTSTDQAHLIRGIGWISGGFKLGAVETVIGFAQGGFGGALTRRILRFLARAFLIIGIVKGVDHVDDFDLVTKEMSSGRQQLRRSRLGMLISNPRLSTFRQLSPTATAFRAPPTEKDASRNLPDMEQFVQLKRDVTRTTASGLVRPQQRVTVQFEKGAPTLHMRFSGLEMPSPAVIAESVKARPVSSSWVSIARSSRYAPSTAAPSFAFDAPAVPLPTTYPEFIYDRGQGLAGPSRQSVDEEHQHRRMMSGVSGRSSVYPDSLTAVRELASQFPILPPGVPTPITERSGWDEDLEAQRNPRRRSCDEESVIEFAVPPVANTSSPEVAPMRYAYGGMEYPESPEPVYRYAYDGVVVSSPEEVPIQPHPYAYSPPVRDPDSPRETRHRNMRSDTTLGTTPMTYLSEFSGAASTVSASTPDTDTQNPFEYDYGAPVRSGGTGKLAFTQNGVPQPVYMEDGPRSGGVDHGHERQVSRSSAALLQMTQRGDGGVSEAWTPPEFTPSMLSLEQRSVATTETSSVRHTLKKKRRPSVKGEQEPTPAPSVDTFASSWLHGDLDADADDEYPGLASRVPVAARVKSVGRVRAPRKATPAPVNARHGITRGSVYIQPITVPPATFSSEVQIVQGGSSADSYSSEFGDRRP
ncbi:hypothetical protein B0H11DRAFT_2238492 [Mycena galericulata]|nr:hypothetical protein B0H11DRAFT_2238492 [Mycena galericulata]